MIPKYSHIEPDLLARLEAKGSDKQFREFVQKQRSALSLAYSEYLPLTGEGRCLACHYRTAGNSGIGVKPVYSCIPLTDTEHRAQHRMGQYEFMPRHRWETLVDYYRDLWLAS